ncbi:MAG: DUF2283 domain-containing protein [Minisyncoccota bacterium]
MKINYDKIADAMYFSLKKGKVAKTLEMNERLIVDVDKKGNILGIEMLDASSQLPKGGLENGIASGIPVMITAGTPIAA